MSSFDDNTYPWDMTEQDVLDREEMRDDEVPPLPEDEDDTDTTFNLCASIVRYENGDLDFAESVTLFQYLVDTGLAWTLQGHYGRIAAYLIGTGDVVQR